MQKLSFLKPALPLTVISVVIALLLAFVNAVTADKIAENALIEKENAIKGIFTECQSFEALEVSDSSIINEIGKALDENGNALGYYADISPIGFKGAINLIVGTDIEAKIIKITLVSASETPGVGTKATDDAYLAGYAGLNSQDAMGVDTITGATISSKAVREGVSSAVAIIEEIAKEGK